MRQDDCKKHVKMSKFPCCFFTDRNVVSIDFKIRINETKIIKKTTPVVDIVDLEKQDTKEQQKQQEKNIRR